MKASFTNECRNAKEINWPSPKFLTSWELSTGPSCWGSPANTSWPTLGHFLVVIIPAMAIRASGSLACPHSSMKTKSNMPCIPPVTSLHTTYNTFTLLTPAIVSTAECVRPNRQNSSVREACSLSQLLRGKGENIHQ